jgi:hypothetical protein
MLASESAIIGWMRTFFGPFVGFSIAQRLRIGRPSSRSSENTKRPRRSAPLSFPVDSEGEDGGGKVTAAAAGCRELGDKVHFSTWELTDRFGSLPSPYEPEKVNLGVDSRWRLVWLIRSRPVRLSK